MATTLKEFAPNPYFSNTNVHLVDINAFAKCYEILSMSFIDINKPKHPWTNRRENSVHPHKHGLRGGGVIITKYTCRLFVHYFSKQKS